MRKNFLTLIALFKSMGESVTVGLNPDYSEDGEILEYGRVSVEGDLQTLFSDYGKIAVLEEIFTQLILEADELLPELAGISEEERVAQIEELLSVLQA